jgi:undecaprenyl-diphosphatase
MLEFDKKLFFLINNGLSNPVFDFIFPFLREPYFWAPVYFFFAIFFVVNYKKTAYSLIFFAIITFILSDQLSAHVIKPYIGRLRPCQDVSLASQINLLIPCGSGYSFPSSHATNHFGFSTFLIVTLHKKIKWLRPSVILWAFSVCFAQVYVGVHYPLDVFFGGTLGVFIGLLVGELCRFSIQKYFDPFWE